MQEEAEPHTPPKWLKRIQENSWEPEILISGGAILALFTLSDDFLNWFEDVRHFFHLELPGLTVLLWVGLRSKWRRHRLGGI